MPDSASFPDPVKSSTERESLSSSLRKVLNQSESEHITLNDMMEQTGGRGLFLVMILLSLPFITPIPLPGFSNVIGPVISLLAVRLAFRLPPRLPKFIGGREISRKHMHRFLEAGEKFLQMLERLAHPRFSWWLEWPAVRFINALFVALMGIVLALPIPPVIPFSNLLPSWAIIFMALAMMEADGILVLIGFAVGIGTLIYMALFAGLILKATEAMFNWWF